MSTLPKVDGPGLSARAQVVDEFQLGGDGGGEAFGDGVDETDLHFGDAQTSRCGWPGSFWGTSSALVI